MRPVLVIGCGGSGGAVLRYMMDQLSADLSRSGITALPQAWQFVHIDVPVAPDDGPGLLKSVPGQGGSYTSLAKSGTTYASVGAKVDELFRSTGTMNLLSSWRPDSEKVAFPIVAGAGQYRGVGRVLTLAAAKVDELFRSTGTMNLLSSWRPDPEKVSFPIVSGAGQYRAVGRVLTLAAAKDDIAPALGAAWARLKAARVRSEMARISHAMPDIGEPTTEPLVLIISSMAGGSGAAMVLDMARLASLLEGHDPKLTALFLFSPDAFEGLPADKRLGVEPNAAAALGELIAMQAAADGERGSQQDSENIFKAVKMNPPKELKAFGRVFPMGRKIGHGGGLLGDGSTRTVYRALGRGISALMLAGTALEEFVAYDVTNTDTVANTVDRFGWGVQPTNSAWGSFGFASMSLGRDRYAEYAAQRLARAAVDRLATGHQRPNDERPSVEQVRSLLDQNLGHALEVMRLPQPDKDVRHWFAGIAFPDGERHRTAISIVNEMIVPLIRPDLAGDDASRWLDTVRAQVQNKGGEIGSRVDGAARRWAFAWYQELAEGIIRFSSEAIASLGLPYTIGLLERTRAAVLQAAETLRTVAAAHADPTILPATTEGKIRELRTGKKEVLRNVTPVADELRKGYNESVELALRLRSAGLAAQILMSLNTEMLHQLEQACRQSADLISRARLAEVKDIGLAQLKTDDYGAWPRAGEVPDRFEHAVNEVLVTSIGDFPSLFDAHIVQESVRGGVKEQVATAAHQIIVGSWPTVAGLTAPGGLITTEVRWHPSALPIDPTSESRKPLLASRGHYVVNTGNGAVLERAREFVNRPQQPFSAYSEESLFDFIAKSGDLQRADRERLLAERFREALRLASPVVGVAPQTMERLHGSMRKSFKFSAVPLKGLPVAQQLVEVLRDPTEGIAASTELLFEKSMSDQSRATRIDIFGSWPSAFPLVFTSFLQPIAAQWTAQSALSREQFWQWRRARPLAEAIPAGQAFRRAMVAGWIVGDITGRITVPDSVGLSGAPPVTVWDAESGAWIPFPNPLVVPRSWLRSKLDVLPAVLETMVIAMALSHDSATLEPLRPYSALRKLFDDGISPKDFGPGLDRHAGAMHIARWLRDGKTVNGVGVASLRAETSAERQVALLRWLAESREGMTAQETQFARAHSNHRMRVVDLAADFRWAIDRLEEFTRDPAPLPDPVDADGSPSGGMFGSSKW